MISLTGILRFYTFLVMAAGQALAFTFISAKLYEDFFMDSSGSGHAGEGLTIFIVLGTISTLLSIIISVIIVYSVI